MRLRMAGLLLLLGLALALPAEDYGIVIREAKVTAHEQDLIVSADVEYAFNPAALEALENGVPLTLLVEFTLERERALWFNETILEERRSIQIRYHPLAKSYQVADLSSGAIQSFASLSAVKDTLSRIRGWRLTQSWRLDKTLPYLATLRLKLDIEALPLPLRAVAYLPPQWRFASPTLSWRVEP